MVSKEDGVESALERGGVERAADAVGVVDVVEGAVGDELVEEPEALLGEGECRGEVRRCWRDGGLGWCGRRGGGSGGLVEVCGEGVDGGVLEESPELCELPEVRDES